MYFRLSALLPVAAFVAVAAAAPSVVEARTGSSQCSNGQIQCCNTTQQSTATTLSSLGGLLGIVLPTIEGLIGLGCSPITAIGTGIGASCTQQTVCCTNNQFNGLVNLGCNPINLTL